MLSTGERHEYRRAQRRAGFNGLSRFEDLLPHSSHLLSSYLSRTCVPTGCQGRIAFRGFFFVRLRNRASGRRRRRRRRTERNGEKKEREREGRGGDNAHVVCVTLSLPPPPLADAKDKRGWATGSDKIQQLAPNWRLLLSPSSRLQDPPLPGEETLPPITDRPEFT